MNITYVKQRVVEVFSTDPSLINPPAGRERNTFKLVDLRMDPRHIPVRLMSRSHGASKARVGVVDLQSRQILESFLVMVELRSPKSARPTQPVHQGPTELLQDEIQESIRPRAGHVRHLDIKRRADPTKDRDDAVPTQ